MTDVAGVKIQHNMYKWACSTLMKLPEQCSHVCASGVVPDVSRVLQGVRVHQDEEAHPVLYNEPQ